MWRCCGDALVPVSIGAPTPYWGACKCLEWFPGWEDPCRGELTHHSPSPLRKLKTGDWRSHAGHDRARDRARDGTSLPEPVSLCPAPSAFVGDGP